MNMKSPRGEKVKGFLRLRNISTPAQKARQSCRKTLARLTTETVLDNIFISTSNESNELKGATAVDAALKYKSTPSPERSVSNLAGLQLRI